MNLRETTDASRQNTSRPFS